MKYINQIEPLITNEQVSAVTEYLQSGGWLTEFKKTEEFEQMIADFLGVKYCVVVTSGTVALYLALLALGIGSKLIDLSSRREVLTSALIPDFTMIATPNAVKWAGGEVILCDVEEDTLCLDLKKARVASNTKAMIYVPINGRCGDMNEVVKFCNDNRLMLIEDACQAFGSKWNDKYLGTFGCVGIFSFTPHKIITTGQGGAIVTNHDKVYARLKKLKDFHRTKPGVDVHDGIGYNFKFTDLQAVIGIEQMRQIENRMEQKKYIYGKYMWELRNVDFIEMLSTDGQTVPWFVDIILKGVYREDFISYLNQNGIGSRQFYPRIHYQAPYSDQGVQFYDTGKDITHRGIWLPSSIGLSMEDIKYICDVIKKFPNKEKK